jgi:hypothetical protein
MTESTQTSLGERDAIESFYAKALSAADRAAIREARRVGGLNEEVALLRALVRRTLEEQPNNFKAIEGGVRLVMQLLVSQRRIAESDGDELTRALARVFEGLDVTAADVD